MKLSRICIDRPVFSIVLSLMIIVIGIVGYSYLELRYFPKIAEKTANVTYKVDGASPSLMKESVTIPAENALNNVDNLKQMVSTSSYGKSSIDLTFYPNTDMTMAMGQIRDALSAIPADQLPADIDPPSVSNGGVSRPVLTLGFMDPSMTPAEIRDYITRKIQPQFENIEGMGGVWIDGVSQYAMRIWLDPQKMAAYGVTTTDVKNVLTSNNITFSGGSVRGQSQNYSIVSDTSLKKAKQFENMIIRDDNGALLRLKDIATVKLGSQSLSDPIMKINDKPAIRIELRPLDSANPITVAKLSEQKLKEVQQSLPKGMKMFVTYNQSTFLENSIDRSFETLFEAIILVMIVVFFFLGSLRASLVPILTIPVCVIGAFGVMLLGGFSINVVTLLAIILAIGLVVDDAIVVLENIHRHVEMGASPREAALVGSAEIGFSVIAMTLTLAAVYAPIGFLTGLTASIFREFAFTLAGAVLISGFVALTLSPMMCAYLLKQREHETRIEKILEVVFKKLNHWYGRALEAFLNHKYWIVLGLVGLGVLCYVLFRVAPQSFIPKEDIGYFEANTHSPPNATLNYTSYYTSVLNDDVYKNNSNIKNNSTLIFSNRSVNFVTMQPWGKRQISTQKIIEEFAPLANQIPGVKVSLSVPDPVSFGHEADEGDVVIYVGSYKGTDYLLHYANEIVEKLKRYPGIHNVNTSLKFNTTAYNVTFNRNMAASVGVNLQDVADTFSVLMSGKHITNVLSGNKNYNVIVQMNLKDLSTLGSLDKIYVASSSGQMIPLANLVTIKREVRQASLFRFQRMDSAKITANLSPGYVLGDVYQKVNQIITNQPGDVTVSYGGRIAAYKESSGTMMGLFLLALVFIYLVLAAQFESFVDPFIILLTVPLSIVGALGTMLLTGGNLNLFTNIGLITLVGLISKHGILITQFANDCFHQGMDLFEAVKKGAVTRLRPILMTTSAMVLGSIPLAIATGPGNIANNMIGWIIVGGLIFGTIFSLFIVPVAYLILSPLDHKKRAVIRQRKKG